MISPVAFRGRAAPLIGSPQAAAVERGTRRFSSHRAEAVAEYPDFDAMRRQAREIRLHTLSHLGHYLGEFAANCEAAGGRMHWAGDAEEAVSIICGLVGSRRLAVKAKSMVTEEIELNHGLEAAGVEVVETDLGEFIAQLAGERPSHIIAPVLHKTAVEIGLLFADKLGSPNTSDSSELNQIARRHLRRIFLEADVGISGVNLGVASTGSIVTVTNEGNGRLVTTLPRVHIAVMGMERLVPGIAELGVVLEVLARSATGQRLSAYTNLVTGPRQPGEADGPDELHIVVVDNGRSQLLGGPLEEILACIRCGACLNVCPVFKQVGGHAYGSVYSGPVGAVFAPAVFGLDEHGDLPFASTLCGACKEVCPIGIDIPRMLLELRRRSAELGIHPRWLEFGLDTFSRAASLPSLWSAGGSSLTGFLRMRAIDGWVESLPGPAGDWTMARALGAPPKKRFQARWRRRGKG
ncbi:MAG TPA: LutB/LldF family L-lactate oxidation iron-sulfur protein [Acidimicrobiia bacterium]